MLSNHLRDGIRDVDRVLRLVDWPDSKPSGPSRFQLFKRALPNKDLRRSNLEQVHLEC